jgi:hypothetical protein
MGRATKDENVAVTVMWGDNVCVCADQESYRALVRGLSLLICLRCECFILHERTKPSA